jgi:sulfite reductase alpha subunit-like flavoprotein
MADTVLYFGCRSRTQDLFFEHDWEEMERHGARVRIAPSRDQVRNSRSGARYTSEQNLSQVEKIYVQDLIKQDAKIIHDWVYVRQGYVYISG